MQALPEGANIDLVIDGKQYHTTKDAAPALMTKLMDLGKHLPVLPIKPDASDYLKNNAGNVSPLTTIGTLYGKPLYVRSIGGWYNAEDGKVIPGNEHQLHATYNKLSDAEKKKYQWGFGGAGWDTEVDPPSIPGGDPQLRNRKGFEGSSAGNVQRLNNSFKRLYADLEESQQQGDELRKKLPFLEKAASGTYSKQKELSEAAERLAEVTRALGSDAGEGMVTGWVPSQALIDALGPESTSAKFMLFRARRNGVHIGDVSDPVYGKSRVFTGSLAGTELPPTPGDLWLEPKVEGRAGGLDQGGR